MPDVNDFAVLDNVFFPFQLQDAAGVADGQGADPPVNGPGDDGFGGFVLGLADAAPVPRLYQPLTPPVMPPPPRPCLPGPRGAAGGRFLTGLAVGQVHPVLGADRPPRHQQSLAAGPGHRIGMDDAQIHPSTWAGSGSRPTGYAVTGTSAVTSTHSRPAS